MKKIFMFLLISCLYVFTLVPMASAANIGIAVDGPLFLIENVRIQKSIDKTMQKIFSGKNASLLPVGKSIQAASEYRKEKGLNGTTTNINNGNPSYQWRLKKAEMSDLGKKLGTDYLIVMNVVGNSKTDDFYIQQTHKARIIIDTRIFDVSKADYIFMNTIVEDSKHRDYQKAVRDVFQDGLKKIVLDVSKI